MTVAQMRALIPDPARFDRAQSTGDGVLTIYELPNSPVVAGSEAVLVNGAAQATPADYSLDDATGVVTFVVAPPDTQAVVITFQWTLLSDADLTMIDTLENSDVRRATAQALDVLASNEALLLKMITSMDLATNGPAVARELRLRATSLRKQSEDAIEDPAGQFEYSGMVLNDATFREQIRKSALEDLA